MTRICTPRIAKRVMFSESCSAVWIELRLGASARTLKSIRIKLGPSPRIDLDHLNLNHIKQTEHPFVNHVKYLGVMFDKRNIWTLIIEMIEAKAFRTFIRDYFLFKSKRLSANIKLTLRRVLNRSAMTYACPAWECAAVNFRNCSVCKTRFSAALLSFRSAQRSTSRTWLLKYRIYTIT
jgi:hypothetical protein